VFGAAVGNKDDPGVEGNSEKQVATHEARRVADQLGIALYETSAMTNHNIEQVWPVVMPVPSSHVSSHVISPFSSHVNSHAISRVISLSSSHVISHASSHVISHVVSDIISHVISDVISDVISHDISDVTNDIISHVISHVINPLTSANHL